MNHGDFKKNKQTPIAGKVPQGISSSAGRGLRLCEEVLNQCVRGGGGGSVCVLEAVSRGRGRVELTASSDGCTCLSCCAPRPRCDS